MLDIAAQKSISHINNIALAGVIHGHIILLTAVFAYSTIEWKSEFIRLDFLLQGIQIYYSLRQFVLLLKDCKQNHCRSYFFPSQFITNFRLNVKDFLFFLYLRNVNFCSFYAYRIFIGSCPIYLSQFFVKNHHKYPVRHKYPKYNPSDHQIHPLTTVFNSLLKVIRSSKTV